VTTGSISEDLRGNITTPYGTMSLRGFLNTRVWSGGDGTPKYPPSGAQYSVPGRPDIPVMHNYSGYRSYRFDNYATVKRYYPDGTFAYGENLPRSLDSHVAASSWGDTDQMVLLSRLSGAIKQHDWNIGVFVGELGETVDLVMDTFRTVVNAGRLVKRGNLRGAARVLGVDPPRERKSDSFRDKWLALRYGWRPMMRDIWELSKAIEKIDKPRVVPISASFWKGIDCAPALTSDDGTRVLFPVSGKGKHQKRIIAYIHEEPFSLDAYLGLADPLSIAWELFPLSFVVDWFLPIGQYIDVRSVLARTQAVYCTTEFHWWNYRVYPGTATDRKAGGYFDVWDMTLGGTSFYSVGRVISTVLDVPSPSMKDPGLSLTRWLDLTALASSVFGGGGRRNPHG